MAASAAQTRVKEEIEKSIEKLERDQLRGLQVSKNLLDQQGCFKVAGYSAVKPWIVIPLNLRRFLWSTWVTYRCVGYCMILWM